MDYLDQLLMDIAGNPWTIRHACEGVQVFGGIGSGKTTGSGRTLALKYLNAGFGGLVLTVKPDECDQWKKYCKEAGRENDLRIIEPYGNYSFNFLDYEANREGQSGGKTENLLMVLKTVIKASSLGNEGGGQNDRFWDDALDMLLVSLLDLCLMGKSDLNIDDIFAIARSLPKSIEQKNDDDFRNQEFFKYYYNIKSRVEDENSFFDNAKIRQFQNLDYYFWDTFLALSERTRGTIEHMLWGFLFRLSREPIYSLFCSKSANIKPEDSIDGKIIILNLPIKIFDKVGRDVQILFKYIWQRAMERRDIRNDDDDDNGKAVFLWADEAQNFIHEHDFAYQATARSSRVCTVYLSQNMNNYLASLGGGKQGEHQVKSFLGTLSTKIFHSNADFDTNMYAANLFGKVFKPLTTKSKSMGKEFSTGQAFSYHHDFDVPPEFFTGLLTGGPMNNYTVQAYIHRQGTPWIKDQTQQNYIKTHFTQRHL